VDKGKGEKRNGENEMSQSHGRELGKLLYKKTIKTRRSKYLLETRKIINFGKNTSELCTSVLS
jgi:hypothetical protein